jgi:ureidoglycolate hydrolase
MKFHKQRTGIRSPIEGAAAYAEAFQRGELERIAVLPASKSEEPGVWSRIPVTEVKVRQASGSQPLEMSVFSLRPRSAIIDELTRHRETWQVLFPIIGSILVAVGPSMAGDSDRPDPTQLRVVELNPGSAIRIEIGTWHTLPFCFSSNVICTSIMHREDLDSYHDVRDLAAEGWIGFLEWPDPE